MTRLLIAIWLASLWAVGACQAAPRRVALVVGASNYAHAATLAHTLDDARGVATALEHLGFEVDLVLDPDRAGLEGAVRRLGKRALGAEASLFYYSGHALEAGGANWIVPVGADVTSDLDLRFETLDLGAVLEQTKGSAQVSLVFLDACRDDPFKIRLTTTRDLTRGGLAQVNAAVGTYIAFATAPGMVAQDGSGAHSPFTGALLKHIETPGIEVRTLLSMVRRDVREATNGVQIPWDVSSLEGEFYFKPAKPDAISDQVAKTLQTPAPQIDADALFWDSVRNSRSPADINAYLAKFPNGVFAELARNRLAELRATPTVAPAAPLNAALAAALAISSPKETQKSHEELAASYSGAPSHKAIASYLPTGGTFRVTGRISGDEAEEDALEACQIYFGGPCALLAVDEAVKDPNGGSFPSRDMMRVRYVGIYDPSHIPSVKLALRQRSDVANYWQAPSPKAMAYHPAGNLFVVSAAPSQNAAEQRALADCNSDPARNGRDGSCYLYAVNNDVVLARRSKEPITPAAGLSAPPWRPTPPPIPEAAKPPPFPEALAAQLDKILSALPATARDNITKTYVAAGQHKALAYNVQSSGSWRATAWPTPLEAEDAALEGCEAYFAGACGLIAVDESVLATTDGTSAIHSMLRNRYAGIFDPEQIPGIMPAIRHRADVQSYAAAAGAKAAAYHPWGQIYLVTRAHSQNSAEADALAACNGDPTRKGQGGPCYLYASADQVVLPRRLRLPLTQPVEEAPGPSAPPKPVAVAAPPPPVAPAMLPGGPFGAFKNRLSAQLGSIATGAPRATLEAGADAYIGRNDAHKALAASPGAPWIIAPSIGATTVPEAQILALERCQFLSGQPCTLVATDITIFSPPADGKWPLRDMVRLAYAGDFDPWQVPFTPFSVRDRRDVSGYILAPVPKAAALDVAGNIFVISGSRSQKEAEQQALASCGPACYLYAAGAAVIFPQRLKQARAIGNSLADVLSYAWANAEGAKTAEGFGNGRLHKAIVFLPESGRVFSWPGLPTMDMAEQLTLEACQIMYNSPCVTLAVDNKLVTGDPAGEQRRRMPRVDYQGEYRSAMVPLFNTPPNDLASYERLPEPKAMAVRPLGPRLKTSTGRTLAEAEAQALAGCNEADSPFPCFLYAANRKVILPQRRTEAEP
ncbi:Uncharacterized protein, contains caspase domain [Rhizobiales bacterium GAS113]|nr:Uncharacterized protein, contains caspase domain [Rhizobiales bacterium GAS113]